MMDKMRRGFSIFLVLFFGLWPLTSALDAGEDANLPPCCRRHGAHHCAMAMQMARMMEPVPIGSTPVVSTPLTCPYYPGPAALLIGPAPAILSTALRIPALREQVYAAAVRPVNLRSRPGTTHAGRGPPATI